MSRANDRFTHAEGYGPLVTKTATATLTKNEIKGGRIVANTGDTAIALTLPPVTSDLEMKDCLIVNKAGDNALTILAPSGGSYWGAGGSAVATATLTQAGEKAIVTAIDGAWYITCADALS